MGALPSSASGIKINLKSILIHCNTDERMNAWVEHLEDREGLPRRHIPHVDHCVTANLPVRSETGSHVAIKGGQQSCGGVYLAGTKGMVLPSDLAGRHNVFQRVQAQAQDIIRVQVVEALCVGSVQAVSTQLLLIRSFVNATHTPSMVL